MEAIYCFAANMKGVGIFSASVTKKFSESLHVLSTKMEPDYVKKMLQSIKYSPTAEQLGSMFGKDIWIVYCFVINPMKPSRLKNDFLITFPLHLTLYIC